jgi:hypothetical protein
MALRYINTFDLQDITSAISYTSEGNMRWNNEFGVDIYTTL